jgi:hypothetical protein
MVTRYALYTQARARAQRYAARAFADSVHTGLEYGDDVLAALQEAEDATLWDFLHSNPRAAAVYAARRWWAREKDAERERLTAELRAADERWRGIIMPFYEAGCPGASSHHPAIMAGRDLQLRIDAALGAWDADWRDGLLRIEARHTTRGTEAELRRVA